MRPLARFVIGALVLCVSVDARAASPTSAAGRVRWSAALSEPAAAAAHAPLLEAANARREARERLSRADTLGADSVLASPVLGRSVWAWESAWQRADFALERGDTTGADRWLASLEDSLWTLADRAAWSALRARTRAWRGDTASALELARLTIRLYPGLAPSNPMVRLIESIQRARGDSLSAADERSAIDVDVLRGDRQSAVRRMKRERGIAPVSERSRWALRIAEQSRHVRRFEEAAAWADSAHRSALDAPSRERAQLESARIRRSQRSGRGALESYEQLMRVARDPAVREACAWEAAREAQDSGEYARAESAFVEVSAAGGRRAEEAHVLAGLCAYARGERETALERWSKASGESARFWEATALRDRVRRGRSQTGDAARADSLYRTLAALPGYRLYRAAARESLGVRGWPGEVAVAACEDSAEAARLAAIHAVAARGNTIDAVFLLNRWMVGDVRVTSGARSAGSWLSAASIAYGLSRPDLATRLVDRAMQAVEDSSAALWPLIAWAHPPAFEEIVRPNIVDSLGMDAALVWGLIRQESRFDPRARSVSNALGLAQLLLPTAGDVARWLRDPPPTEARLFEPDIGARYGIRYLAYVLSRFDRNVAVALTAYNAGPGTIRPDWRLLLERGGDALFSEFASNADSQDYTRRILGFRQAYRELQPTFRP